MFKTDSSHWLKKSEEKLSWKDAPFFIHESTDFKNKRIDKHKLCEMSQSFKKCSLQYAEVTFQLLSTCIYRAVMEGKLERYYELEKKRVFLIEYILLLVYEG